MIFDAGLFCRKELSPKGEPARRAVGEAGRFRLMMCTQLAASREVLLGKEDLPKFATILGSNEVGFAAAKTSF